MTISLYNTHVQICQMLERSDELWESGSVRDMAMSVVSRIGARLIAAGSGTYNLVRFLWRWPTHVVRMGYIFSEGTWGESFSRLALSTMYLSAVIVQRISVLFLSTVLPEIFLQKLKVHYTPLFFGLRLRAQYQPFEAISRRSESAEVDDQEIRTLLSNVVFSRVSQGLEGRVINNFSRQIWIPALVRALEFGNNPFFRYFPSVDFFSDVQISRPLFGRFKDQLVRFIAEENRWLFEKKIFTKEDIEDISTTFAAVINLAIFRMTDLMTLSNSEISIFGKQLSYENSGELFDYVDLLRQLVQTSQSLSLEEKNVMKYHLIADEDRVAACEGYVATYGRERQTMTAAMRNIFFAIGRFRTQFLEKKLGDISESVRKAFVL